MLRFKHINLEKRFNNLSKRLSLGLQKQTISTFKKSIRFSNKFWRVPRNVFEHRKIKTFLGGNLAILALLASAVAPSATALGAVTETEKSTFSAGVLELTTKQSLRIPVNIYRLTQRYSLFHRGVDLDGLTGDPIFPIMSGTVESVVYDRFGYGKHVIINHGSGLKSLYAHLSKIEVNVGEQIDNNHRIGLMGNTGRSFGDHLHLEVYDNEKTINPLTILPGAQIAQK